MGTLLLLIQFTYRHCAPVMDRARMAKYTLETLISQLGQITKPNSCFTNI